MNKDEFKKYTKELGIELTEQQLSQLDKFYKLLIEWNEKINLTRITDEKEVYLKHFYDSLTIAKVINLKEKKTLCDVGTGAGFPGIVLKIVYPNLRITLVDSLLKRVNYLNEIIKDLELNDIEAIHIRGEDFRGSFDVVTSRAVANLATLSEYLVPLAKINGKCLCMKGPEIEEEVNTGKSAIKILGGTITNIYQFNLPNSDIGRSIVEISKVQNTNKKYPRKAGLPSKEPLH